MTPVLTGGCGCGAVRLEIDRPLHGAAYCHCTRCQHRSGAGAGASARTARGSVRVTAGEEHLRRWEPEGGWHKVFCGRCGSGLFAEDPDDPAARGVRLGAIDGDPGVRPGAHQFTAYAAAWEPLPEDGLPRFPERQPRPATWEAALAGAWERLEDANEAAFHAAVDAALADLPAGDPAAAFERACAQDSTGHPDAAVPLYRAALAADGLDPHRRRRATIQLASSLRLLGRAEEALALLEPELARHDVLDGAVRACVALVLADLGREREGLALVLGALAPTLPRYRQSMARYAEAL
jgi:hypothetical protein